MTGKQIVIVCGWLLGLIVTPAQANDSLENRATLKGLHAILVTSFLEKNPDTQPDLTLEQIQTDVELRLRRAGVTVVDVLSLPKSFPNPPMSLSVTVRLFQVPQQPLYVFTVCVAVEQAMYLARTMQFIPLHPTWSVDNMGVVGTGKIRAVRDHLGDLVDRFINDYLTENPKASQ